MTLADLKIRAVAFSIKGSVTFDGLLSRFGVQKSVVNRGVAGAVIDLITAHRLLPLVQQLVAPGEVPALECQLPTGGAVVMSPETFAELQHRN